MADGAAVTPIDLPNLTLDSFAGRPVAVLGLARSGIALARFLHDRGATVTVYDGQPAEALTDQLAQLGGRPVRLMLGPEVEPSEALAEQALVCTSPSVSSRYPTTEPRLRRALGAVEAEGRVPVVSEVDLFLRLCPAPTVGITGTKGKTTTSSLTAAVISAGPARTLLGGNIGTPLVERLPEITTADRVVLELSELQLPTISRGTEIAVYTHVSSDHLDRHGTVEAYRLVKQRLAELLPPDGALVINDEDPVSRRYGELTVARAVRYSRSTVPADGVGLSDGWIVSTLNGPTTPIMPLAEVPLPGFHNASNVLAAVAAGLLSGVEEQAIRQAVADFGGVEHRLEEVAVIDRVRFVNDSSGTQPDAVISALRAFDPPVVLIAGGRSKDVPLEELAHEVARRAAAAVLIGETAEQMEQLFEAAGAARVERAADLPSAVTRAADLAREALTDRPAGEGPTGLATVLMSPAAASFDMFVDYAARGRAFKQAVLELQRRSGQVKP
ncbi:MAG TPA: UDP-N-acetylmuramoyl-L-alanine--D-glutamate ligase [Candidatus Limnocylindrales bacterium]|nr:UDP-N-acetylmuramoyl-L-alanine--D-glutamate ligase [Candidatus Limnocylindrales bacterium]